MLAGYGYTSGVADRQKATGDLGLVQAFVNTVDLQDGPEELSDPNTLKAWLVAKGLLDGAPPVDASDLKHAIALREAIRSVIGANSGSKVYPVDIATLNEAAAASGLRMRFGVDGKPKLEPEATGVVGAMGRIVAAMYAAMEGEDWGAAEALQLPDMPMGLLRPLEKPLQPLVRHGLLREPRESPAFQEPEQDARVRRE